MYVQSVFWKKYILSALKFILSWKFQNLGGNFFNLKFALTAKSFKLTSTLFLQIFKKWLPDSI